jgi:hypothetical protein
MVVGRQQGGAVRQHKRGAVTVTALILKERVQTK